MRDVRIQNAHHVQGLHNVRTVVARQADISFELEFAFDSLNAVDDALFRLWSSSADLKQSQYQGSKFVSERHSGKSDAGVLTRTIYAKAWCSR
ncbi:hypothetical protein D3C73_1348580 [compost metagenome]